VSTILALANQKGGVGKTTTCINLGAGLAQHGRRVLLVDIDPQANATSSLGYDKQSLAQTIYDVVIADLPIASAIITTNRLGLDLIPSGLPLAGAEVELVAMPQREYRLRQTLEGVASSYDYVLIDCPPSLGLLTVNALVAAHGVIIPIQCEYLALEGLSQLLNTIQMIRRELNPRLTIAGVLMTMYDARTTLAQQVVREVETHFPGEIFKTIVPRSVRLAEAPSYGQSIFEYDGSSRGAAAYRALTEEVLARHG
jgi:chromosome partitioning protein